MRDWPRLHPHRQRHVARLRWAGRLVLAVAICIATYVYRVGVLNPPVTVEDLMPGTAQRVARQRGILFGRTGAAMIGWFDFFGQPAGHAVLIGAAGVIGFVALYQVAHEIELEEG